MERGTGMTTATALQCQAIVGQTRGDFRFVPVHCTQTVAIRGYWSQGPGQSGQHFVTYCSIEGHRANCERRYPFIEGQVESPDPMPDPIDEYKWTHDRDGWPA